MRGSQRDSEKNREIVFVIKDNINQFCHQYGAIAQQIITKVSDDGTGTNTVDISSCTGFDTRFSLWFPEVDGVSLGYGFLCVNSLEDSERVTSALKEHDPIPYCKWIREGWSDNMTSNNDTNNINSNNCNNNENTELVVTRGLDEEISIPCALFLVGQNHRDDCAVHVKFLPKISAIVSTTFSLLGQKVVLHGSYDSVNNIVIEVYSSEEDGIPGKSIIGKITGKFVRPCSINGIFLKYDDSRIVDIEMKFYTNTPVSELYDEISAIIKRRKNVPTSMSSPLISTSSSLLELPDDILGYIFSQLSLSDLFLCSQASKHFNDIFGSNFLWQCFYEKKYSSTLLCSVDSPYSIGITWRDYFRQTALNEPENAKVVFPDKVRATKCVKPGRYILSGFTENYGGNITRVDFISLELFPPTSGEKRICSLKGNIKYKAGSAYNDAVDATWIGTYDIESGVVFYREKYGTHSGYFYYSGRIVGHRKIVGRYFWTENGAIGQFNFTLEN